MKKEPEIIIRRAKPGDEVGVAKMMREGFRSKSFLYMGSTRVTKEKIKKWRKTYEKKPPEAYVFLAVHKPKNKIIGSISLMFRRTGRLRHRADMGWSVHPDYQKKGVGTKLLKHALAFAKKKGFKRVEAEMAVKNKSSWKLALKCGFKIEGTKKKGLLTDEGKYIDTYFVGKIL